VTVTSQGLRSMESVSQSVSQLVNYVNYFSMQCFSSITSIATVHLYLL